MEKLNTLVRKIYVSPSDSVSKAVEVMNKNNVSGLAVVDNGVLVGVISAKDFLKALMSAKYHNGDAGSVALYMVSEPDIIVKSDVQLNDIIDHFVLKSRHYYPVVNYVDGKPIFIGTLYRYNLLNYVSSIKEATW